MNEPDQRNGRTECSVSEGAASNLTLRVISAAVLAPAVLACTYAGGWIFFALCAVRGGRRSLGMDVVGRWQRRSENFDARLGGACWQACCSLASTCLRLPWV